MAELALHATHRCNVCSALWRQLDDGNWNLRSATAGMCCDNASMDLQIIPLSSTVDRLEGLINSPHTAEFLSAVRSEVAHQIERWGTVHDRAKAPADWFWLLGFTGGKANTAHQKGDTEKALHHCISSAAVLANWWAHIKGEELPFTPGSSDLQRFLEGVFGADLVPA